MLLWNLFLFNIRTQTENTDYSAPTMLPAGYRSAASSVHYTTSCKFSLMLLRMGEIIACNKLSCL